MRSTHLVTTSARRAGRIALASLVVVIVMGPSAAFATPTAHRDTLGKSRAPIGVCQPIPTEASLLDNGANLEFEDAVYGVQTSYAYWSVAATRGSQGYDTDLNLHGSPANRCNKIGTSLHGLDAPTDWVAWDNNGGRYPVGPYVADMFEHAGGPAQILEPKYLAQFVRGSQTLSTISPLTEQPVGHTPQWIVDIRDVLLSAGITYTFTVTGGVSGVYLLHSDTANSSTWAQSRNTSTPFLYWPPSVTEPLDVSHTGTFTVTPTQTSWYGALFVCDGWWGVPTTVRISTS